MRPLESGPTRTMANITLRQLHIFTKVVELGSFRRCAEHLEISQVAVSDHIRELEQRLGGPLFARRAGGPAVLTAEGQRAQRHIGRILAEVDQLLAGSAGLSAAPGARHLHIGAQAYLLRKLQGVLLEYQAQRDDVKIDLDLTVFTAQTLAERLQAQTLDAGYFFSLDVPTQLESEYAWTEPLGLFVGPSHPLARQERVALADITTARIVQLTPGNPLRPLTEESLRRAGLVDMPVALQTDDLGLLLSSVQKGLGFACLFEQSFPGFINPGSLLPLSLEQPLPSLQVRRAVAAGRREDATLRELLRRLGEHHTPA